MNTAITSLKYVAARVRSVFYPFNVACMASAGLVLAGCGAGVNSGTPTSTPRFSPRPGTYTSTQTVTVSDQTIGAAVYCTVDGSTPSTSSNVCPQPITISGTQTIKAIAIAPFHTVSAMATGAYAVNLPAAAAPVFSPAAGTFTAAQMVAISDATPNARIYYTTDGSTPTTSSTFYSGLVAVTASETLNAIAVQSAYSDSAVSSAAYLIQLPAPTPTISTSTGSNNTIYGTPLTVTISDANANAAIFYAVGAPATTSSTRYTGPISVTTPGTINAIAVDVAGGSSQSAQASASFTVTGIPPTFSPAAGTIHYNSQVALADADPGAKIYYTLDGSTPTASSTVYTNPITISANTTIEAIAVNPASGYLPSANASAAYTIPPPTAAPVISAAGGSTTATYPATFTVSITDPDTGAAIYYTTDGSTPSATNGTHYTGSFQIAKTQTVNAIAVDSNAGAPPSAVVSQPFSVLVPAPVFAPAAGVVASGTKVTLTDADPGATIYYTTNGSVASPSSMPYTGPITISAATTFNAIAVNTGYTQSNNVAAAYSLVPPLPTPAIVPAGGLTTATYPSTISVSITDSSASAAIYYTLDGSVPSATNGTKYTGLFHVSSTATLTAIAVDPTHTAPDSAVATQAFTIVEAAPTFSPAAGTVTSGTQVTISNIDPGATIYYTTTGSAASTSSPRYTGPITIPSTVVLHAVAANNAPGTVYTQSVNVSASYTIPGSVAPPTISTAGGLTSTTYPGTFSVSLSNADSSASIYYTLDGSVPSATNGTKYSVPFTLSSTLTVNAIAIDTTHGTKASFVSAQTFTIVEATPMISPASGVVNPGTKATLTDADPGATIYYSTDGKPATTSSTRYAAPFALTPPVTVNAVAINTGAETNYTQSEQASASYTAISAPSVPVITTVGGQTTATYPETVEVTITASDASASIYYTTDGSTPSKNNGTLYASPFGVGATSTIKAVAVDPAFPDASAVASQAITITEATPTFLPAAGLISPGATVNLKNVDSGATIHYTTDGSAATTSSSVYSSPIAIAAAMTIHAVAINTTAGQNRGLSEQASASYTPYSGSTVGGTVASGTQPIVGASIQLVAAGVSGYGAGSTPVTVAPGSRAVTDSSGGFSLGYTCPAAPGDQLYLVATGGSTVSGDNSPSIALMVALGTCSKLATNTSVTVNELTTIAAAYSLSGFSAPASGGGIVVGAPAPSAACSSAIVGKSTCNYRGLANALLTPGNLVDPVAGIARTITPYYSGSDSRNLNGWSSSYGDPKSPCPGASCLSPNNKVPDANFNTSTAPYQRVNTLGNVLASCVEQQANCTALFALTGTSADTLQAALYIAQHPFAWNGTAGLYALIANPASAFTPPYGGASTTLSSEPNDWVLAITITGAGLGIVDPNSGEIDNQGIAVDGQGNVWVTAVSTPSIYNPPPPSSIRYARRKGATPEVITIQGYVAGLIAGFDPIGEALTPPTSSVDGTIAYDAANGYASYGGYGPNIKATHGLGQAYLDPFSFLIDASQQIWINNGFSVNLSETPPGSLGGSMVAIASAPAPTPTPGSGSANLALSHTSADVGFPYGENSLLADSSANLWGSSNYLGSGSVDAWNGAGTHYAGGPWFINFDAQDTSAGDQLCNLVFDTNGTLWGDDCGYAGNNGQVFAVSLPDTSNPFDSSNVLGDYPGAATLYSPSGTLAAGAGGNVYACDSKNKEYLVFNSSNPSAPVSTLKPPAGRCGQFLTVDGAGHIWSYSVTANGPVLDEIDSSGNAITPATGLTGTSAEEQSATGLALFNATAANGPDASPLGGQQGSMAADPSGNLWFLNGTPGETSVAAANALVEIIGVAAPTVTPTAVATQNGAQGTKP